jgi:hypothetical protein
MTPTGIASTVNSSAQGALDRLEPINTTTESTPITQVPSGTL